MDKNYLKKWQTSSRFEEIPENDVKCKVIVSEVPTAQLDVKIVETYENTSDEIVQQKIKNAKMPPIKVHLGISEFECRYEGYQQVKEYVFCMDCKKIYNTAQDSSCPNCSYAPPTILEMEDYSYYQSHFRYQKDQRHKTKFTRYIFTRIEGEAPGISIYKVKTDVVASQNNIFVNHKIEAMLTHVIGEKGFCRKINKKSIKEIDSLDFFNINSKTIHDNSRITYELPEYRFLQQNIEYFNQTGCISAMSLFKNESKSALFILTYTCLIVKFPVLEQLIKAGHYNLFNSLYNKLLDPKNKTSITNEIKKLKELVDVNATTSKKALRFPTYIGQYLSEKNSELSEYYFWRDIYELTAISKENFENFIKSPAYCLLNINIPSVKNYICDILKYGYKIEKLYNYILKQSTEKNISEYIIMSVLKDYLVVSELLGVEIDKYPQNLIDSHDRAADVLKEFKTKIHNDKISSISNQCKEYLYNSKINSKHMDELSNELLVIFPKSAADFIEEGNKQHNCVGGYCKDVAEGEKIIFFIRQKSEPEKSYITAEITSHGLGQCLLSNNRAVNNQEHFEFAQNIANKICRGCKSDKINSLKN